MFTYIKRWWLSRQLEKHLQQQLSDLSFTNEWPERAPGISTWTSDVNCLNVGKVCPPVENNSYKGLELPKQTP